MERLISQYGFVRAELGDALRTVLPWVIISVVLSWAGAAVALIVFDIKDLVQHVTLSTVMPILIGIPTLLPLAIVRNRLKQSQGELERLLLIDLLTGLPNRRAFFEHAELAFRTSDTVLLMMIDIDHFKTVNDIHGHDSGDTVLCNVAQTIESVIHNVPGKGERLTARLGGEEFCILMTNYPESKCGELAQSVVEAVRKSRCRYRGVELRASVSIGIALRFNAHTVEEVLRNADNAVYRAKRLGRDQWRSSSPIFEQHHEADSAHVSGPRSVVR